MFTFPRHTTQEEEQDIESAHFYTQKKQWLFLPWLRNIIASFLGILLHLLPSWLQPSNKQSDRPPKIVRPTMYLDGLRGLVAVLVFARHFSLPWQQHLDYGYGYQGYYGLLRLPFARLLFSGPLVPVFFIVSGYVLSAKTLKLSRKQAWEPILLGLSASAFRRAIRLFLPPILSTFGVTILVQLGFFSFPYDDMPGRKPVHPEALNSVWDQLGQWFYFVWNELTNPWRWSIPALEYGPHLWTIPISFKGSLVVFIACLGMAQVKCGIRFCALILLSLHALLHSRWEMAPFVNGMLLCELDIRREIGLQDQSFNLQTRRSKLCWLQRIAGLVCFTVGLYLGSFPRFNAHGDGCVTGYQWLCHLEPEYEYWHGLGAAMVMLSVSREKLLQWPLQTSLMQYLGSVSFSMYIIHEPFLHVFAFFTVPFFWALTGNESLVRYQGGFLLGMIASAFILLWIADLFKMHIEQPCVKLSAWVEKACFVQVNQKA